MCAGFLSPVDRLKRDDPLMEEDEGKRSCSEAANGGFRPTLPDAVVRQLTFGQEMYNGVSSQLPPQAVREMKEEAYR